MSKMIVLDNRNFDRYFSAKYLFNYFILCLLSLDNNAKLYYNTIRAVGIWDSPVLILEMGHGGRWRPDRDAYRYRSRPRDRLIRISIRPYRSILLKGNAKPVVKQQIPVLRAGYFLFSDESRLNSRTNVK